MKIFPSRIKKKCICILKICLCDPPGVLTPVWEPCCRPYEWWCFTCKLLTKSWETLLICHIPGKCDKFWKLIWYHWKANVFTFHTASHSLQLLTFKRRYGTLNDGWVRNQMCQNETFSVLITIPFLHKLNQFHSSVCQRICFGFIIIHR